MGVSHLRLMTNNPLKVESMDKYGLDIVERISLQMEAFAEDKDYLKIKQEKMHHHLNY